MRKYKMYYNSSGRINYNTFLFFLFFTIALVGLHIVLLTNLRFEVWPEMLVMPYLMRHGFELYRDMIVPWTPGLMWMLSGWFGLFGLSPDRLKLLTWILIAGIDILIYLIASKRYGRKSGLLALAVFVVLQPVFDGNGMWFDVATVPLLLLAFYWQQPLLLGPAFLIKQSVVWLFPLVIGVKYQILYKLKYLILGMVGAIGGSILWFWMRGTAGDYWRWAYDFAFRVFPKMPGHMDLGNWRQWIFVLVPFLVIGGMRAIKAKKGVEKSKDPFIWAILSIPFALPRFGLFHFQPAVAFLALAAGSVFDKGYKAYKSYKGYKFYILALVMGIWLIIGWSRVLRTQWYQTDRFLEPEVFQLAAKIALGTDGAKPVLLVNSPELVYVIADRLPPKPWLTQFPWFLELPGFQDDLISQFKQQNLDQVFATPYQNEDQFVPGSYRPKILLNYIEGLSNHSND